MILTTAGTPMFEKQGVLLETIVRRDFQGVADTVFCVQRKHDDFVSGDFDSATATRSILGRMVSKGQSVTRSGQAAALPLELLREPFRRFQLTGIDL